MKTVLYMTAAEFKIRLKASLRGLRFWLYLLFVGCCILEGVTKPIEDYGTEPFFCGYMMLVWGALLCRGKMGKLLYLLPMEEREKKRYIYLKFAGIVLFECACFLTAAALVWLISKRSFLVWVDQLFFRMVPYVLVISTQTALPCIREKRNAQLNGLGTPQGLLLTILAMVATVPNALLGAYGRLTESQAVSLAFSAAAYAVALLFTGYTAGIYVKLAEKDYTEGEV